VAPAIITGFSIVGATVPQEQMTEGLTWITSALGAGISIGSAATGQLAGGWGGRLAFACAASCAAAAALTGCAVAGSRNARR
jgi:MFS family permease